MAAKNVILALLALCSLAYGQTRALFVNTNGTVQWGTTLRFDGPLDFTTNSFVATTRSNLSLGLPALTNTSNAGLLSALGALATNGSASALTNFPELVLTTNSSASAFPAALLRTNGDGSGLTNLPNANLSNATGILPIANGGTGTNSAAGARTALQLGTAATNDASAFQPANTNLTALAAGNGSNLTNVTITDASTLTNFPASLLRTNGDGSGLSNVSVNLSTVLPAYSNNAGKVLSVAAGSTNVEWIAVSNTVTDASALTNFPAFILQTSSALTNFPTGLLRTNGSAAGLTAFPASLLTTNGSANALTNFPTLNQNTTGTASNVTGVVAIANGGSGQTTAAAAIEAFLPAYSGNANRILALNSNANGLVWTTNATGGGGGSVDLSTTNATGILPVVKGGTGATSGATALTNLGILQAWIGGGWAINVGSTNTVSDRGVIIGSSAKNTYDGVAVGSGANGVGNFFGGVAVGFNTAATNGGAAIGHQANSADGGAIGRDAVAGIGGAVGHAAQAGSGGAIGRLANSINGKGFAGGQSSEAIDGFAGGLDAKATATSSSQIGAGTNTNNNTLQFMSAGSVDTNEWARIAALSTYPTTNIQVTVVGGTTNTLVFSNGILTSVTSP